jgi:hypothetical protein
MTPAARAPSSSGCSLHLTIEANQMNGYIAFYRGRQIEVYSDSSYQAQQKAAAIFKAKKAYEVTVVIAEKNGEQVTHSPASL